MWSTRGKTPAEFVAEEAHAFTSEVEAVVENDPERGNRPQVLIKCRGRYFAPDGRARKSACRNLTVARRTLAAAKAEVREAKRAANLEAEAAAFMAGWEAPPMPDRAFNMLVERRTLAAAAVRLKAVPADMDREVCANLFVEEGFYGETRAIRTDGIIAMMVPLEGEGYAPTYTLSLEVNHEHVLSRDKVRTVLTVRGDVRTSIVLTVGQLRALVRAPIGVCLHVQAGMATSPTVSISLGDAKVKVQAISSEYTRSVNCYLGKAVARSFLKGRRGDELIRLSFEPSPTAPALVEYEDGVVGIWMPMRGD